MVDLVTLEDLVDTPCHVLCSSPLWRTSLSSFFNARNSVVGWFWQLSSCYCASRIKAKYIVVTCFNFVVIFPDFSCRNARLHLIDNRIYQVQTLMQNLVFGTGKPKHTQNSDVYVACLGGSVLLVGAKMLLYCSAVNMYLGLRTILCSRPSLSLNMQWQYL